MKKIKKKKERARKETAYGAQVGGTATFGGSGAIKLSDDRV